MKAFLDQDFLLTNETAQKLFHNCAEQLPIIDYHCHISPKEIYENRKFDNITQAWLEGDHYKWRLIRSNGVREEEITGSKLSDRQKFQRFAEALPKAIGNPLYHWTHLELRRYFGCDLVLSGDTAEDIWNICNEKLKDDSMSVCGIIERSNVKLIATTDDPADDLIWHKKIKEERNYPFKVVPSFRPDKAIGIEKPEFDSYLKTLSKAGGTEINSMDTLFRVLGQRIEYFDLMGCRASDHGLEYVFYRKAEPGQADAVLKKRLNGETITAEEVEIYKTALLLFLAQQYSKRGWAMQIHYNALRNTNTKAFQTLGPDSGFDCMGSYSCANSLTELLDAMNREGYLPKTIIYSLNPNDNAMIDSAIGCFQSHEAPCKIQHGCAWWFNDTKTGMENQMISLANGSLLGNFVGMVTDSRSFLSYTRHEYFRRILCNLIGTWVENGEYPNDAACLEQIVKGICFENAEQYFGFRLD